MEASGDEHSIELHADIEERKFSSEQIYQINKKALSQQMVDF